MRQGDKEIYKKCRMDCFNCPFPDCKMSESAPDLSGIHYEDEVHIRRKNAIEWTPEMDKVIVDMRRHGKAYSEIAAELGESYNRCRDRFLKITNGGQK